MTVNDLPDTRPLTPEDLDGTVWLTANVWNGTRDTEVFATIGDGPRLSASVAAVLFAAAITPGPNNLVVMDAASRGRLVSAVPPIAGIVIGTVGMVLAVRFGLDATVAQWPTASSALRYVGAALLLYLASRTVIGGWTATSSADRRSSSLPSGTFLAMLLLQIVNPKT